MYRYLANFFIIFPIKLPQIIDPHDTGISESINKNLVPVSWDTEILKSPLCLDVTGVITDAYMEYLSSLRSVQYVNFLDQKDSPSICH